MVWFKIEHYKGDLHLFNLKQKIKGRPVITAEEFERLTDISSISGSDSDSDDDDGHKFSSSSSSSESDCGEERDSKQSKKDQQQQQQQPRKKLNNEQKRNKVKVMFRLADTSVLTVFKCILFPKNVRKYVFYFWTIYPLINNASFIHD